MKRFCQYITALSFTAVALTGCNALNKSMLYEAGGTALQALTLTNDQITDYVKQSVAYMDRTNTVAPASSPYTQRLNRLTAGMTHVGNIPLNFKVYQTKDINAFACADGSVRVYTGIMDMMTDDELLGIIGHEIGHVALEHSKNAFKQELMNTAILEAVSSAGGAAAQLSNGMLSQLAKSYVSASYSRKQEDQADEFGYEFLKGAGRNPYSLVNAFEKMQALENKSGAQSTYYQKMFSSHPETADRIAHIKRLCEKDGYKRP